LADADLFHIIRFLEDNLVPDDQNIAELLVAKKSQYNVIEGVLY
jgi:hypothetical protein